MKPDFISKQEKGVYFLTSAKEDFETVYLKVREKEKRLLTDELVKKLPFVSTNHPYALEWKKRQFTLKKFQKYLKSKTFRRVLDIGCGNGWFSHQMVEKSDWVIGLDVGKSELEQATRCFPNENLFFVCCTDLNLLPKKSFDLITFNASIQYFDLTPAFWGTLNDLLDNHGEIHILDSPIYNEKDRKKAQLRSLQYFENIGEPDANHYYHHLIWNHLPYGYSILYRPKNWKLKFFKNHSPFAWLMVQKRW